MLWPHLQQSTLLLSSSTATFFSSYVRKSGTAVVPFVPTLTVLSFSSTFAHLVPLHEELFLLPT